MEKNFTNILYGILGFEIELSEDLDHLFLL